MAKKTQQQLREEARKRILEAKQAATDEPVSQTLGALGITRKRDEDLSKRLKEQVEAWRKARAEWLWVIMKWPSWDPLDTLKLWGDLPEEEFWVAEPTVATTTTPIVDREKETVTPPVTDLAEEEFMVPWVERPKTLAEQQIESDIEAAKKKREEQLAVSKTVFEQELERETQRIETEGKRTMDTLTRSLALRWWLRWTAWEQRMWEVQAQVNSLISTAQSKADLELQLRDAQITWASEERIKQLNTSLSSLKTSLAEQATANIEAQLEVAAEIWADALESVLWIISATWMDVSWVDREKSKETSYIINTDWSLFLWANWKPVPLVKKNEFWMDVKLTNFKDANDNTYVYKNWELSEIITNQWDILKWEQLKDAKVPASIQEDKDLGEQRELETQLRKEFIKRPEVKRFQEIWAQFERVKQGAAAANASWDIALVFSFMKMLDPGSVVRESEFATAQNAAWVPDQVRNLYNKALQWTRLWSNQRAEFKNTAESLFKKEVSNFNKVKDWYVTIIEDAWARPKFVIVWEEFEIEEEAPVTEQEIDDIFWEEEVWAEFLWAEELTTTSWFKFKQ